MLIQVFDSNSGNTNINVINIAPAVVIKAPSGGIFGPVNIRVSNGRGPAGNSALWVQDGFGILQQVSTLAFANENNVSFGFNGAFITASIVGGGASLSFQNGGGVSFTNNAGTVNASVRTDYIITANSSLFQLAGNYLTTAMRSDNGSNFVAITNSSLFQLSGNYLTTAMRSDAATLSNVMVSAPNGSTLKSQIVFNNSNGFTFSLTNGSIVGSYTVPNVPAQSSLVFSNANGVTFGTVGSTLTASVKTDYQSSNANYLTSQSNAAFSASGGSSTFQTLNFANSNGFTFSNSAGSIIASYTVPSTAGLLSAFKISASATSLNLSAITFANSNGFTFGLSNNSVMTASYTVPSIAGLISAINISAGATSANLSAVTFGNGNGVSFGITNSIITASIAAASNPNISFFATGNTQGSSSSVLNASSLLFNAQGSLTIGFSNGSLQFSAPNAITTARASTDAIGLNTAQSNVTWTVNSSGLSFDARGYAGTGTTFAGANISGSITHNSVGLNLSLSVAAPGAANVNFSAGSTSSGIAAVTFSNANGVSFGLGTGASAGVITATVVTSYQPAGAYLTTAMLSNAATISNIKISGGGNSSLVSSFNLSNANGVTWGFDGTNISASVVTTYQPAGAYLTTADLSQNSSKYFQNWKLTGNTAGTTSSAQGTDFWLSGGNGVTLSGSSNSIVFSVATNYQSQGAYLTTAMLSNAATISNINVSAGASSLNLSAVTFANSNGISFGLSNNSVITASYTVPNVPAQTNQNISWFATGNTQGSSSSVLNASSILFNAQGSLTIGYSNGSIQFSAPNALTTAMASNANTSFVGLNSALTANGVSATINSSGISLNFPAFLTTQAGQAFSASGGSSTFSTLSFNNANGFTFSNVGGAVQGSYTVPTQSNQNISFFATGNTQGSSSTVLNASSLLYNAQGSLTIGFSNGSLQFSAPNAITTARASTDAIGLNTAQSNVTWTVNSSGLSFDARGYAGTGSTFAGANISGSMTINSVGVNLSFSVAAPGGGGGMNVSAGTASANLQSIIFANGNNISFGLGTGASSQSLTASVAASYAGGANWFALGNTTQNSSSALNTSAYSLNGLGGMTVGFSNNSIQLSVPAQSSLQATGAVSISTNGSTISIGVPSMLTQSAYQVLPFGMQSTLSTLGNGTVAIMPMYQPEFFSVSAANVFASMTASAVASSVGATLSVYAGIYSRNGSTLSLLTSGSTNYQFTNTSTASTASIVGMKKLSIPFSYNHTFTGDVWVAFMSRLSTVGNAILGVTNMMHTAATAMTMGGLIGEVVNVSKQIIPGMGFMSVTSAAMPSSIAFSAIVGSNGLNFPYMNFVNYTA